MKQIKLLVVLAWAMCNLNVSAQIKQSKPQYSTKKVNNELRELKVEKDGFEWYKVKKNGKWGAENKKGNVLVPIEYGYIDYQNGAAGFRVTKDGNEGYYNTEGECIIPCSRHYYIINKDKSSVGTYYWGWTKKDGPLFFCDAVGEEICQIDGYRLATPQYKMGKFFWEVCLKTDDDNSWCILDGNGNMKYGPSEFVSCGADGTITGMRNGKFVELGNVSTITTTNNPFTKANTMGIRYSSTINSSSSSNSSASSSSSSSSSNSSNSGSGTTTIHVEHHHDPVPVQQWQACIGCGGMGTMGCDNCGGSGTKYIGDRLHRCSRCNGRGIIPCNVCFGNKGQYITVYK